MVRDGPRCGGTGRQPPSPLAPRFPLAHRRRPPRASPSCRARSTVPARWAGSFTGTTIATCGRHHSRFPCCRSTSTPAACVPSCAAGRQQTKSLRFSGADGREYVFRSIDKDPSPSLPPELRETYAKHVARDLISAQHPGGSLVVARLRDAAGVLHVTPQLAVMPDDPRLGEFRQEFAGMLGLIELRPTDDPDEAIADGTGMTQVASSEKLFERITEHADETVDSRAFLAARLFDMFVGDWDRHPDQWRWARTGNTA